MLFFLAQAEFSDPSWQTQQTLEYVLDSVGNILRRHGIPPDPERKQGTTWKEFIASHREVLAATDFFTTEIWTLRGLVTY